MTRPPSQDALNELEALAAKAGAFETPASGSQDPAGRRVSPLSSAEEAATMLGQRVAGRRYANTKAPTLSADARRSIESVYIEPGEIPRLMTPQGESKLPLPLIHTHVNSNISGDAAQVEVTQTYQNPFTYPIEAVYVFPLPENSAVNAMKIIIGARVIEAKIDKRQSARRTYEAAKHAGKTAALLEQERPNIFTQSIANMEPGTDIEVVLTYVQDLTYDSGTYEFVFPVVVGPRFNPGQELRGRTGTGWGIDTNQVPDASRISPPLLGRGVRSGHDISIEVHARAGLPIHHWDVPTHRVVSGASRQGSLALYLDDSDTIPNRDFVLKYRVDGERPAATVLVQTPKTVEVGKAPTVRDGGFFKMIIQPPTLDLDEVVGRRELIFVVDVSGSMSGVPLAMCQDAMRSALSKLRPVDTFNVITFAGRTGMAFSSPRPVNTTSLRAASTFISDMRAGGGTYMRLGVEAALQPPVEQGRHRYVFLMTDGYIGNESEITAGAKKLVRSLASRGQTARVFTFGPGSSVNRHLLEGIAKAGAGQAVYSSTREDPALAVNGFFRRIDHSVVTDIEIDWQGFPAMDIYPSKLPDLFASRPLVVHGRFSQASSQEIRLKGTYAGRRISIPVTIDASASPAHDGLLPTLWAREKIASLNRDITYNGSTPELVNKVTNVGLSFGIVTAYTSFVAVDEESDVDTDGPTKTVVQPALLPEGVNGAMATGRFGGAGASRTKNGASRTIFEKKFSGYAPSSPPPAQESYSPSSIGAAADSVGVMSPSVARSGRLLSTRPMGVSTKGIGSRGYGSGGGGSVFKSAGKAKVTRKLSASPRKASPSSRTRVHARLGDIRSLDKGSSELAKRNAARLLRPMLAKLAKVLPAGGKFKLRWTVGADGKCSAVKVIGLSNLPAAARKSLENAFKRAILTWAMPHTADSDVRYEVIISAQVR